MNMKRKGVDQVSEDFSEISLLSPATKIRRLDAELPPIVEVELEEQQPLPEEETAANININQEVDKDKNKERALVLFKPLLHSSSPLSLSLHSDFISGFNNQLPWSTPNQSDSDWDRITRSAQEERQDKNHHVLALVPWVPLSSSSHFPPPPSPSPSHDLMEAEEMRGDEAPPSSSMMDIEQQDTTSTFSTNRSTTLHQWQQQHCLLPQLPQNTSTPITWTR